MSLAQPVSSSAFFAKRFASLSALKLPRETSGGSQKEENEEIELFKSGFGTHKVYRVLERFFV